MSTYARWFACGLAIWAGFIAAAFGIISALSGNLAGLAALPVAALLLAPAWFALRGGSLNYLRWVWGLTTLANLAGCSLIVMGYLMGVLAFLYSLAGLIAALIATEKDKSATHPEGLS